MEKCYIFMNSEYHFKIEIIQYQLVVKWSIYKYNILLNLLNKYNTI